MHLVCLDALTPRDEANVAETQALHPDWEVRVYREVPQEPRLVLARYYGRCSSTSQAEDLIRLDLVHKHGGVSLKRGTRTFRDFTPLLHFDHFVGSDDGKAITGAAFGALAGHEMLRQVAEALLREEPDWPSLPTSGLCGTLFSQHIRWMPNLNLLPRDTFSAPHDSSSRPSRALTYAAAPECGTAIGAAQRPLHIAAWLGAVGQAILAPIRAIAQRVEARVAHAALRQTREPVAMYAYGVDLIVQTTRGIKMALPGTDLSLTPEIAITGTYEERECRLLESQLRPGDWFVDVGCNVGSFALVAARAVGPYGRVYAIDANAAVLEYLRRSLVMNWVHDRVRVHHTALGNTQGTIQPDYSPLRLGDGSSGLSPESTFYRTLDMVGDVRHVTVPQMRLDDLFPAPIAIKALKIDVEGAEHLVLEGAWALLASRCVEWLIIELLEEVAVGQHAKNLAGIQRIVSLGYELGTPDSNGAFVPVSKIEQALRQSRNVILRRCDGAGKEEREKPASAAAKSTGPHDLSPQGSQR